MNFSWARRLAFGICLAGGWFLGAPAVRAQEVIPLQEESVQVAGDQLLLLRAEQITREGQTITCVGKVRVEYEGLTLDCQWLRYDRASGQVMARKECLFTFGQSYAASDEIDFSLISNEAVLRNVTGRGNDLGSNDNYVEQPLFFWAKTMSWKPDFIQLSDATVTTCDKLPGQWDYRILAERVDIYPRDRLEAYNTSVDLGGFRPATLPNLTFSLDPTKPLLQDYLPTIGYSAIFGAFIRTTLPYNFDRKNAGKVHLDYYTRTGISGGIEHRFNWDNRAIGDIYFYQQRGVNGQSGRLDFHTNSIVKLDPNTSANFSYSQNKFELPSFTSPLTVSTNVGLTRQTGDLLLMLQASYSRSGDNTNTTYVATAQKDFSDRTRLLLTGDYNFASTIDQRARRFHYLGSLQHRADFGYFEAALESSTGLRTYFLNRTPELRFVSTPIRIGELPLLASASYARIFESPSDVQSARWDLRLTLPDQMYSLGSSRLVVGGGLRQFFYDTGQKQRVWLARASLFQPVGDSVTARVDYQLQDQHGLTPFFHDIHQSFNVITGGLEYYNSGSVRLGAYAGYDFKNQRAHDVVARMDLNPAPEFNLSSGANFDPVDRHFRSMDNLVSLRLGDSLSVSHWSLYDFQQHKMTYQDVMLNFESHDWVASFAYRGLQQEVFFQLNLRGFPSAPLHIGPEAGLPVLPNNLSNPFVR
ncbi:hypothetical protein JST97_19685 [bacterium]|nr:hypothetical protein [bacterium]